MELYVVFAALTSGSVESVPFIFIWMGSLNLQVAPKPTCISPCRSRLVCGFGEGFVPVF